MEVLSLNDKNNKSSKNVGPIPNNNEIEYLIIPFTVYTIYYYIKA